jgi:Holliday junction resolvase RusA-like endonuclease
MWTVKITGTPAPKGSLKCVGKNGHHQLIEDDRTGVGKSWRQLVTLGGKKLLAEAGDQLKQGPVSVDVIFTVRRPDGVSPAQRGWPWKRGTASKGTGADVDKLARMVLDGLTDSHLIGDDAQVVELAARKCYPDTLDCPDALPQPGAVIRIWRTDQ